jgi:hypothetical protein
MTHQAPPPSTAGRPASPIKLAEAIEPSLTIDDVCKIRNESRRSGERERSAGLWPKPDFYVGTGSRKSPRWLRATVDAWLLKGGRA